MSSGARCACRLHRSPDVSTRMLRRCRRRLRQQPSIFTYRRYANTTRMEQDKPLTTYLRMYRLRRGFSHEDMAFLLGVVYGSNVCKHEKGRRIPALRAILAYEIILGAPARELFEGIFHEVRAQVLARAKGLAAHVERRKKSVRRVQRVTALRSLMEDLELAQ